MRSVKFSFAVFALLLGACAGRDIVTTDLDVEALQARAIVQTENLVTVATTVLTPDEARQTYGFDVYDGGVQPVWLSVENNTPNQIRYAPVSTDREYYAPLEVAYVNRGGFNKQARDELDRQFYRLAMPRYVGPGETASGIVLTHAEPGTKGFNVDLFGSDQSWSFNFFVTAPGFVPDHEDVDFANLYQPEENIATTFANLPGVVREWPCCSTQGEAATTGGIPINVIFVGSGNDLLYSLLRAHWRETDATDVSDRESHHYFGRSQDGTFRYEGGNQSDGYYELRLWMSPVEVDGERTWVGHVRHWFSHRWLAEQPDPDIDIAQDFLLQNLWYSGALMRYGKFKSGEAVSLEDRRSDNSSYDYFSSGDAVVLWVSGDPIALTDVEEVTWNR